MPFRLQYITLLCLFVFSGVLKAQPCLTGWTYRVPVIINNTANASTLTNHQIALTLNTQQLIVKGKAKLDGGDIRFLDKNGAVLPFWVNPDNYNSISSEIWVKVNTIAAASLDTIYLFYGEASSLTLSNGDLTFELFDDFIGSTINASKWTSCNGGNFDISGGTITFGSTTATTQRATLTSTSSLSSPIVVEADVESIAQGLGFIGQRNGSQGYALAYEDNGQPTMRMVKFQADANCFNLVNVNPPNNASRSANSTKGLWSFSWFGPANQRFLWPGQTAIENRNDTEYAFPSGVNVSLGNINLNGTFELDWVRARKYIANQPSTSLGTEVTSIFDVSASATEVICQNGTIQLTASSIAGAGFSWTGPNGFTSTDQNPTITNASLTAAGTYTVTATIPNSCSSASASVTVSINPSTVAGILSGDSTVCENINTGTVRLSNQTGNVIRWESSPTGLAPWTTIDETNTTLGYENIVNTTFYRAIVQSGVCNSLASNVEKITVDPTTVVGRVLGTTEKCTDVNAGELTQVDHIGAIQRWQFSTNNGNSWTDLLVTDELFTFNNLTTSTWYRTEIKSGVCAARFSDSILVTIHPLPIVDFTVRDTCEGFPSQFIDKSTIASGSINRYEWNFSNGTSSVNQNPLQAFPSAGEYAVILTAESAKGCIASNIRVATVNPLPEVAFNFENVCDRNSVNFIQQSFISSGSISAFQWKFGDDTGTSIESDPSYLYSIDNTYPTTLVVTSSARCVDSLTKTVTIYPRAELEFVTDSVFLGQETSFINNSTINGGNLTYEWRFGDGDISRLVSPTHKYKSAGDFTATLISTSNNSCKDTLQQTVRVLADAQASFTVENVCKYDSASFVNTSFIATGTMTYKWNFGDGSSSNLENPKHVYATPNTYLVTLVATSDFGSESTFSDFVVINPIPKTSFSVASVCDEIAANFTNLSSITTGALTYEWDFGDDFSSVEAQPSHLYPNDGPYTIQLIATSEFDCKDTASLPVTVFPRPQTDFTVNNACDGFPSFFTDETTIATGSVVSHTWDFGDGTNSIEQNPEKQFLNPRTYQVKLITNSDKNCPNDTTITVKVITAPVAKFSFNNECDGVPISFTNLSSSEEGSLIYTWVFDDGDSSSSQSPNHLYDVNGFYSVTLIASSEFGCEDSVARTVQVYANPTPKANEDQTVSRGFSVQLSVTGSGDFIWTPESSLDNQSSTTPMATPLETTTYFVSVTDSNGCTGSDEVTVTVENDYIVLASNVITPDGNGENDTWYVENIYAYDDSKVMIFDRWGKKIYEQTAYQNEWAGVSNTDILPDGEYYYIISFTGSEKIYKGTITLIRGN